MLIDVAPAPILVGAREATSLALITNELVANTVKHVLAGRETARIAIQAVPESDATMPAAESCVRFEYRDDGPGYPQDVLCLERHNVGLHLVQRLVRANLRGTLSLDNDNGAVATIRFQVGGDKNVR